MTPSARLQAVIELLETIDTVPRPADALVSGYFRSRRFIGSKDRAAIAHMTYDVLRHHARLNWWLEKYKADTMPRARVLVYLALVARVSIPASTDGEGAAMEGRATKLTAKDLEQIFTGKKFAPTPLTDAEQKLLKRLEGHTIEHPNMPESVTLECPEWAYKALKERFGDAFEKEMAALLEPAPLDLRVNPLKITREEALEQLKKHGFAASPCPYSPLGIRLKERPALNQLTLLREGFVEIQDEGSQLVAFLVDAKPGERVVDFCAGAGGKTLAIAAQMQNKGRIIACDVLENRLKRSSERFRRAGIHNIDIKPLANEHDPWVKKHKSSFDRVLVDAPCSGTGTWRRNPDQRWRALGPGLDALIPLQFSILESAARLVKDGGRLIYATCSLLPQENEEQIENFLIKNKDYSSVSIKEISKDLPGPGPYLSLSPAKHQTDGFFTAVMQKQAR